MTGYVAPAVKFSVRLPTTSWTQRLVMKGCGGYCGDLISPTPTTYDPGAGARGCPFVGSGELAVASHNGGHVGNTDSSRVLAAISDGMWAKDNPAGLIDFFYKSNHKATLATKAVIKAFYGQKPRYSYFMGCSSGGRAALHEAQRYPGDYDGILAGAPTIDNTSTNTFLHAWNVRVNSRRDRTAILTSDKIPALADAVLEACADGSGMIRDPRTCDYDARSLVCAPGTNSPTCLTPRQARVANRLWSGPVTKSGARLSSGDLPYGSERSWVGGAVLDRGVRFSRDTSSEFAFSHDFPKYMSDWTTTRVTNQNMRFTRKAFERLNAMHGLNDPTNPDLRRFAERGGKLLMWQGWADQGSTVEATLNYYAKVRQFMGPKRAARVMGLFMVPGVGHCGNVADFLTPLMSWVEDGDKPRRIVATYPSGATRAVYRYPKTSVYTGEGDVNDANNYVAGRPTPGVSDLYPWLGLKNYKPSAQAWCSVVDGRVVCRPPSAGLN